MRKINAYTLFEVTIAMLLSAICIAICYTAYDFVGKYYNAFHSKNDEASNILSLKTVLNKDFNKSIQILKTENGIRLLKDSLNISYIFNENYISRNIEPLKTDTIKVNPKNIFFGFEGREALIGDTVDVLRFQIILENKIAIPIEINKKYSAQNLFK